MATQLTNYQCPACTGPLHFDGIQRIIQKMRSDLCLQSFKLHLFI